MHKINVQGRNGILIASKFTMHFPLTLKIKKENVYWEKLELFSVIKLMVYIVYRMYSNSVEHTINLIFTFRVVI